MTSKIGRTFYLDKAFSCYAFVEMFVTSGVFCIISTRKLVDQDFYSPFPMHLDWRFESAILAQIENSNTERLEMLINLLICLLLMSYGNSNMILDDIKTRNHTISPERCVVTYLWVNLIFNWIIHQIVCTLDSILSR